MVFHWSLSDSKSPQVYRTRLSILTVLSNAVVWIVSTRPPISKFSRPFINPLVTLPNAPIKIGTIVTFMSTAFFFFIIIIIIIIIYSLSFSHQFYQIVFHCSLSDSKSPQVSRTLFSILAVLNNAVVWVVSTRSLTSKSSSAFNNPLVTVPKAPITNGKIVTSMFSIP